LDLVISEVFFNLNDSVILRSLDFTTFPSWRQKQFRRFSDDFMAILNCSFLPMHQLGVSYRSEKGILILTFMMQSPSFMGRKSLPLLSARLLRYLSLKSKQKNWILYDL